MDLMGGYLLIILLLFSANIALLLGNNKFDILKIVILSLSGAVISFVLMYVSPYLSETFAFLQMNFGYLFFIVAILVFLTMYNYLRAVNAKLSICLISVTFLILTVSLASQSELAFFDMVLYSLLVFVCIFFVYQISKLLIHAKRPYPVIISEYMVLSSVLLFIFALTYYSTLTLDYKMFGSFLILTPTYQLIYVIIGIIVLMVVGVFLNENGGI